MVILLMAIGGIILMDIGGFYLINGYWLLFYKWLLVVLY
jgi:hypothetical protein